MELTIAGIIAMLGIMFGLNYFGLFVAVYVFDRTAKHIFWFLAATMIFVLSGVAFFLSSATAYTKLFIAIDDLFLGWGFIALSWGLASAFSIGLSKRFLTFVAATGAVLVLGTIGHSEISVYRLTVVSLWQVVVPIVTGYLILRTHMATLTSRYMGTMMTVAAASILFRPIMALQVHSYDGLSYAEKIEFYGAAVSIPYLIAMFGIGAGIAFHIMSDLVTRYRNASITDSLTGLLNRRGFLDRSRDVSARPAALIMVDIDRFKSINDTMGHDAGDKVIAAVAKLMVEAAPAPHLCSRLGGEEFAILLHRSEPQTAEALAHAIRLRIEIELAELLPDGRQITASFGVAELGVGGVDQALLDADHALYRAKKEGRNAVRVAEEPDAGQASRTGGRRGG